MYKIDENAWDEKYVLLIPAMLDAHFPLIKYAFYSRDYHPVILSNEDHITDVGLKYVNNDMCYPIVLNAGQMIDALQSGKYDIIRTRLLMPTAGDACRGANYLHVLKESVRKAGFDRAKILSLNVKGLEKNCQMRVQPFMVWRALFGLFYGDILMLLLNQTRPNEVKKGQSQKVWQKWIDILSRDLKEGKNLTLGKMKKNFDRIARDFSRIRLNDKRKQRVGIVGELYIKYCHLGNWNMIKFLESNGCESHTNGLSWYAMYYMDSHLTDNMTFESLLYKAGLKFFGSLQRAMIEALRKYGFYTMEDFFTMKREAEGYVSWGYKTGDGWLIGAEITGHILHECPKVLAVQPFGCMPNHTCGRGLYPSLQKKLPQGMIVSCDVEFQWFKAECLQQGEDACGHATEGGINVKKIFVVEDDESICEELVQILENEGYEAESLESFDNTKDDILKAAPNLVLMDINIPGINGRNLVREIRKESDVPIIMVTSRTSEMDEVLSMSYGADDYITKPYNPTILLLRIAAVLKRMEGSQNTASYRDAEVNFSKGTISKGDQEMVLTKNEMIIFQLLLANREKIVSRDEIMTDLWDNDEFVNDNALTVNISRLRGKLADLGYDDAIETRKKQGYRLV